MRDRIRVDGQYRTFVRTFAIRCQITSFTSETTHLNRIAVVGLLPASIVAARFLVPGSFGEGLTWLLAGVGFLASAVGCLAGGFLLLRRVARVQPLAIAGISCLVAVFLLAVFPLMPSWPFTGGGFVFAWVAMAFAFTSVLLTLVSFKPTLAVTSSASAERHFRATAMLALGQYFAFRTRIAAILCPRYWAWRRVKLTP